MPKSVLRSLYFTFINCHTDYNLINWGTAPTANIEGICSKVRKAIRIISLNKDNDEPYLPMFKKLSILPLENRLELKQATYIWKLKNYLLPPSIASNFRMNRNQITIMHNRLESSAKHITYAGLRIWNRIPVNIQDKTTPKSFTKSLLAHFINSL